MIVRILGEGQFDVPDDRLAALNDIDTALVTAVEAGDEDGFRRGLDQLLDAVRADGTAMPDDFLGPSELVLPGADSALADVQALLGDEGLIPG